MHTPCTRMSKIARHPCGTTIKMMPMAYVWHLFSMMAWHHIILCVRRWYFKKRMISGLPMDREYDGRILSVRRLKKWRTIDWLKMNIIERVAGNNTLCSGSQEVHQVEGSWSHLRKGLTYIYCLLEGALHYMVTDAYDGGCWLLIVGWRHHIIMASIYAYYLVLWARNLQWNCPTNMIWLEA